MGGGLGLDLGEARFLDDGADGRIGLGQAAGDLDEAVPRVDAQSWRGVVAVICQFHRFPLPVIAWIIW